MENKVYLVRLHPYTERYSVFKADKEFYWDTPYAFLSQKLARIVCARKNRQLAAVRGRGKLGHGELDARVILNVLDKVEI